PAGPRPRGGDPVGRRRRGRGTRPAPWGWGWPGRRQRSIHRSYRTSAAVCRVGPTFSCEIRGLDPLVPTRSVGTRVRSRERDTDHGPPYHAQFTAGTHQEFRPFFATSHSGAGGAFFSIRR